MPPLYRNIILLSRGATESFSPFYCRGGKGEFTTKARRARCGESFPDFEAEAEFVAFEQGAPVDEEYGEEDEKADDCREDAHRCNRAVAEGADVPDGEFDGKDEAGAADESAAVVGRQNSRGFHLGDAGRGEENRAGQGRQ